MDLETPLDSRLMISVLVPTLNEGAVLARCLGAVRHAFAAQSFELLVVDGGSRDETVKIAQRYGRVIASTPPRAHQLNAAAQQARGEVLLFLHADVIAPEQTPRLIDQALEDPATVGGFFRVTFGEQVASTAALRLIEKGINFRSRVAGSGTGDQALFVRRSVFEELRGFREMPFLEDVEFFKRLGRRGRVVLVETPVEISARRWVKHGPVRTTLLMWGLQAAYKAGVNPVRLQRYFADVRQ